MSVGVDTPQYYYHIQNHFPEYWIFKEEGFRLLSNIVVEYTHKPQIVFIICALISNMLIILRLWDFKDYSDYSFVILLYLLIYYSNSMNIMRQYVAVALIFFGTRYISKKKYLIFLVFLVIAFFFHRSSFLAIFYLLYDIWKNLSFKKKIVLSAPMIVIMFLGINYINVFFSKDIDSYSSQSVDNINLTYLYRVSIFIFANILESTYKTKNDTDKNVYLYKERMFSSISLYCFIGFIFSALSMFFAFAGRTGLYFIIFEFVFWGFLIKNSKYRIIYAVLILIYSFYEFSLVFFRNSEGLFPYYLQWY